jgi:hypothetical protein
MWTEQNVLKVDMELVVCDVEPCAVEMLWMSYMYDMEKWKGCVLDIDMELPYVILDIVLCRYVDIICSLMFVLSILDLVEMTNNIH